MRFAYTRNKRHTEWPRLNQQRIKHIFAHEHNSLRAIATNGTHLQKTRPDADYAPSDVTPMLPIVEPLREWHAQSS